MAAVSVYLFIHLFTLIVFYENQNRDIIWPCGTDSARLNKTIRTAMRCDSECDSVTVLQCDSTKQCFVIVGNICSTGEF